MDFIVKLLFLGGKYISQAAGRTILEIIHRGRSLRNNISIQYEKASEIVKPYDNMLELLNERVREASEDDIHFAYMNDELKKQLEQHMRQLSSINPERTNALEKNNWQNYESKDVLLTSDANYEDLESTLNEKDVEYDKMYTDLCKDLLTETSEVLNNTTNIIQPNNSKSTQYIDLQSIGTKKENSIPKATDNLEFKINSCDHEKQSDENGDTCCFTYQNIKQYTNVNPTIRNPLSNLYYGDAINMNYLVEQSPTDSYYNTNVINKNRKRSTNNISSNKEQTLVNSTKQQKKCIRTSGAKLLNTDDIMQVNNKVITRGLSQEIENRMILLNKNRDYFKIFEKKLHDRIVRSKVKQISKDVEHRSAVMAHNITHYNKFESKLERKLQKHINKMVCRKLSSGISADDCLQQSLTEAITLLKVNEKEFQKLEAKVTQLMIRQGLDNTLSSKINYREIAKPTCKKCLSNFDKEEIEEREKIIEVNRKVFENFEKDISRIVILDKNKGDSINREPCEYRIDINKVRKNISRPYTNRYDMLSNVLKSQQTKSRNHISKCSLSSRDRDDIRERTSILEMNAKAFEMFESKSNNVIPSKINYNLMLSRTLSSGQNGSHYENANKIKKDGREDITPDETRNITSPAKTLKKLIDKSMNAKLARESNLQVKDTKCEIKDKRHVNSNPNKERPKRNGSNVKQNHVSSHKLSHKDLINVKGKLDQNYFEKLSDFKPELESHIKSTAIKNNQLSNSVAQHNEKCLKKPISIDPAISSNLQNPKDVSNGCAKKKTALLLNERNLATDTRNKNVYSHNIGGKDFNNKNIFMSDNVNILKNKLSKQIQNNKSELTSKIPRPNSKCQLSAESQAKSANSSPTNFQTGIDVGNSISKLTKKEFMAKTLIQPKIIDTKFTPNQPFDAHGANQQSFQKQDVSEVKGTLNTQSFSDFKVVDNQEISKFDLKNMNHTKKPYTFKETYRQPKSNTKSQSTSCLERYSAFNKINSIDTSLKTKRLDLKTNTTRIKRTEGTFQNSVKRKSLDTNTQVQLPCVRLSRIQSPNVRNNQNNHLSENITSCTKIEKNETQMVETNIQTNTEKIKNIDSHAKKSIEICSNLKTNMTTLVPPPLNDKPNAEQKQDINHINTTLNHLQKNTDNSNTLLIVNKLQRDGEQIHLKTLQSRKMHKPTNTSKIPQLQHTYDSEIMQPIENVPNVKDLNIANEKQPKRLLQFEDVLVDDAQSVPRVKIMDEKRENKSRNLLTNERNVQDRNILIDRKNIKSISETSINKYLSMNEQTGDTQPNTKTSSTSEFITDGNKPERAIKNNRTSRESGYRRKGRYMCQEQKYFSEGIRNKNGCEQANISNMTKISQKNASDREDNMNEKNKAELFHTMLVPLPKFNESSTGEKKIDTHLKAKETHSIIDKSQDAGKSINFRKLDEKSLRNTNQKIIDTYENQKIRSQFRNMHNNYNCANIFSSKTTANLKNFSNESKDKKLDVKSKPTESRTDGDYSSIYEQNKSTLAQNHNITKYDNTTDNKFTTAILYNNNEPKRPNENIVINKKKYALKKVLAYVPVDGQTENSSMYEQNASANLPDSDINKHFKCQRLNKQLAKKAPEKKYLKPLNQIGTPKNSIDKGSGTVKKYIEPSTTEAVLNQIEDNVNLETYYKNFIINYKRNAKFQKISTRELHRYQPCERPQTYQKVPDLNDQKELSYEVALSRKNACFAKRLLQHKIPSSFNTIDTEQNNNIYINTNIKHINQFKSEILNNKVESNEHHESTKSGFRLAKFAFLPMKKTEYEINTMPSDVEKGPNQIPRSTSPIPSYLSKNSHSKT